MKVVDFDFDPGLLARFLAFPRLHHASDPHWLPEPSEVRLLARDNTPARAARWRNFLAVDGEHICGRVTAIVNRRLVDEAGQPLGQLGFFECVDDPQTARLLVGAALAWLRANNPEMQAVLAPMNFDTWNPYRLRTSGFDQPTFWMEPDNPRYYPALLETLGFTPVARYVTKTVTEPALLLAAWAPYHREALARGCHFRPFNPAALDDEFCLAYRLSLAIFRANLFFVEITESEFRAMYAPFARSLDPELLLFALDPSGEPIGFSFTFPDLRQPGAACIKTFGVLPGALNAGLGAAFAYELYRRLGLKGFDHIHHCLMRAGNRAEEFDRGLAAVTREYALYHRPLLAMNGGED